MESLQKTWMSDPHFLALSERIDIELSKVGYFYTPNLTIILACSGGPDSVFAAYYLSYKARAYSLQVILCYFDHEWREEAKEEIEFCKTLADNLGFLFATRSFTEQKEKRDYNKKQGSKEAEARELRYAFLREMKKKYQADYIILGHHQDDQIETFFIRMIRGTSLQGLCGMKILDADLLRPLLSVSKSEILSYLDRLKIPYCVDVSNNDSAFLRNRVRNSLIPALLEIDKRSINNIAQLIKRLSNAEHSLETVAKQTFSDITEEKNNRCSISISKLQKLDKELQYRVLLLFFIKNKVKMTFSESLFQEVIRFLKNKKSQSHHIATIRLIKENGSLYSITTR